MNSHPPLVQPLIQTKGHHGSAAQRLQRLVSIQISDAVCAELARSLCGLLQVLWFPPTSQRCVGLCAG